MKTQANAQSNCFLFFVLTYQQTCTEVTCYAPYILHARCVNNRPRKTICSNQTYDAGTLKVNLIKPEPN